VKQDGEKVKFMSLIGMRKICNIVQTGAGAHPASYQVCTGDTFSRVKRPGPNLRIY
jgi:hypothetical protein